MMNTIRKRAALATLALAGIGMSTSFADVLYWDGGTSGEWNTTSQTWRKGAVDGPKQAWVNGNSAVFPGKTEITLSEDITLSYPADDKQKVALICTKGGVTIKGESSLTFSIQEGNQMNAYYRSSGTLTIDAPVVLKSEAGTPADFWFRNNVILNGKVSDGGVKHKLSAVYATMTLNADNDLSGEVPVWGKSKLIIGNDNALGTAVLSWIGTLEAANGNRTLANKIKWGWNGTHEVTGNESIQFTTAQTLYNGYQDKKPTFKVAGPGSLSFDKADSYKSFGGGFVKGGNGAMIIKEFSNGKNTQSVDLKGGTLELGNIVKGEIVSTGEITFGKSE